MTATLFALRLGRWGIAGFASLAFVSTVIQALGFYQVAGHTPAERAAFGHNMSVLASRFTVILPPPLHPETVGGYVQYRSYGGLAILFAIWALASASGAARGDEERGIVEAVLATSLTRVAMVWSHLLAFAAGSFAAGLAAGAGIILGAANGGETIDIRSAVEAAVVLAALALSCYSLTFLIAQLTSHRIATAAAGVALLTLFLVNTLSRTFEWLGSVRWLSPFRYYEVSQPLAPGGDFDVRATLFLLGLALVAGAAAATAFAFRDMGSPLLRWPARAHAASYDASISAVWRIPVARGLYDRRFGLAMWAFGLAALGAIFVSMTKSIIQPILSISTLAPYFGGFVQGQIYSTFLGFFWFTVAELLFAAFAITQVARWSAEDADGRLELILSQPQSRAAVVIERALVLAFGALMVAAVSGAAVAIASRNQGMDVSADRLVIASLLLVPLSLVFAAVGSVLAAWNPRATIGLLGGFAFFSYLVTEVGPFFKWPGWVQDISAFKLYGTPLVNGLDRGGLFVMLLIVGVGFGGSVWAIQKRDIGA